MRRIREVLRLYFAAALSIRAIARSLGTSPSTVGEYLRRAQVAGLSWPLPELVDDTELERRLFPAPPSSRTARPLPDWSEVHRELRRKSVTLSLLWQEYKQSHPEGLQYSRFCEQYRAWAGKLDLVMRQEHRFRYRRGLDRQLVLSLADGRWVREHLNVLICGPTGIGKSWLACALAHSACRNGHSALYVRVSRLLSELATARADGRYPRRLESLAKTKVLVMDDWGLTPFSAENRHDLLEVLEDRHGVRSTVVTSQLPVDKWHDVVGDPTLGDAILDRLVHNAYKLDLKGGSMRKRRRPSTRTGNPDA